MDSVPEDTNKPFQEYPSKRSTTYDATGEDRISNLPDSVICHILRFLPTKNAVATAILSKSWETLFASIHDSVLHFDDSVLLHPEQASDSNMLDRKTSFTSFVCRVLNVILRDAMHIDAFFLSCEQEYDDDHINAWISEALSRNVESLHLNMTMKNADLLLRSYPVKNLNTVRLAHIEISLNEEQLIVELEENGLNFYKTVAELVVACSNVDHLWLSKETITGFYDEEGSYECFKEWIHGKEPVCSSLHLKKIELWEFSGEEDEVKLVEYFLTNAKVLEQIEICSSLSLEKVVKISNRLMSFKSFKGYSKTCQIQFHPS
ncbi:hypothetical protein RJ639_047257 [Escallonia herrerae]|uniref:F-box domain-containing protein n=1 Tax=Escallonia herrerae TaxID=1293975 RepID=A0AA88W534_9ASTE|nr:hypothetical protein RJ639_047257 [Escallonia herrerae]